MKNNSTDIAVVGGGASGLAAAIGAAQSGSSQITVFERLPRVGKKILSTGNGRCNLSNVEVCAECYSGDRELTEHLDSPETVEFFKSAGLITRTDRDGRIYPHSMTASSVLDALRYKANSCGVNTLTDSFISGIKKENGLFILETNRETYLAKSVILATGGRAAPSFGSDGSGFALAQGLGHTVTELYPALAPLRTEINLVKSLKGLRMYAKASLYVNGKIIDSKRGEVQFADGALSGICIFDLSLAAAEHIGNCTVSLDAAPDTDINGLTAILSATKQLRNNLSCDELLTCLMHKRIGLQILRTANIDHTALCGTLSKSDISSLARKIKDWRFPVTGVSDWSLAQSTLGGIPSNEVGKGLSSLLMSGLFFCGEILNICGYCGGYNLDWAWRSGYTAGKAASRYLNGGKNV